MRKKKELNLPRQYSLVKVSDCWLKCMEEHNCILDSLYQEAKQHNAFVFLGDIPNMTWHCVVISVKSGRVFSCYHTEDFEEIPEDET